MVSSTEQLAELEIYEVPPQDRIAIKDKLAAIELEAIGHNKSYIGLLENETFKSPRLVVITASDGDNIEGFAYLDQTGNPKVYILEIIAVKTSGQGIGTALTRRYREVLLEKGATEVLASVSIEPSSYESVLRRVFEENVYEEKDPTVLETALTQPNQKLLRIKL